MMHAREKSDSAVVADYEKPSNKAGRPGAEAVERRAEAEGKPPAAQHATGNQNACEPVILTAAPSAFSPAQQLVMLLGEFLPGNHRSTARRRGPPTRPEPTVIFPT
jgi:hypothetical protein